MFGFLNINKPKGITSHDVISRLRRVTKIKQIGHTGTLDPFAEGVLPICIGKATRLIEYLNDDKAYLATLQFGTATDTYDIEGKVTKTSDNKITIDDIEAILPKFRGEIEQFPPIYSAIKINGKKLYEYARKNEEIKIASRKVIIDKLEIKDFNSEEKTLQLYIECSKGTYIRSIANDIGEKTGNYAHLIKLIRTKAGDFDYNNSIKLENILSIEDVKNNLLEPINYLNFPKYELSDFEKKLVSNGNSIKLKGDFENEKILLTYQNKIAAIGEFLDSKISCQKVFL